MHRYGELRDSEPARQLFDANLATLRRLLPLYDLRRLRLSRYGLTGPIQLRLDVSAPGAQVTDLRVALPGEGEMRLPVRPGGRWTARAEPDDVGRHAQRGRVETLTLRDRSLRCTAVLTRAGHPEPNRLRLRLRSREAGTLATSAHIGRYDPGTSSTVDRRWVELDRRGVEAGTHAVEIELPDRRIGLYAYPTHFTPGPHGERVNAYHGTHIVRLRQLAAITGDRSLARWAERWAAYVAEWPSIPELEGGVCWTPEGEL